MEAKQDLLLEETKKVLFYVQIMLLAMLSFAFTSLIWHYVGASDDICPCEIEPFQSEPHSDLKQEL